MSEERLQEIKDSIELQYKVQEANDLDSFNIFTNEEQELVNEVERLNNIIKEAIEYINSDEMLKLREEFEYCNDQDLFDYFAGHLDRILRGSDKE